jgi:hypothetical protein
MMLKVHVTAVPTAYTLNTCTGITKLTGAGCVRCIDELAAYNIHSVTTASEVGGVITMTLVGLTGEFRRLINTIAAKWFTRWTMMGLTNPTQQQKRHQSD